MWAHRRGLEPERKVRLGRTTVTLWDMDKVYRAEQQGPIISWREEQRQRRGDTQETAE